MGIMVVRSASLERLDACAAAMGGFPAGATDILTHAHFAPGIAAAHPGARVVAYPDAGNFSASGMGCLAAEGRLAAHYERVIVLAGNISGAGHLNVLSGAVRFGPVELFNVNNEFRPISPAAVRAERLGRILLSPAIIFATILTLFAGGLLMAGCAIRHRGRAGAQKGGK